MFVLHVITSMDPKGGGVCQAVRGIIEGTKPLVIRNEVLCLDDNQASFLSDDTFTIHAVGPAKGPWSYAGGMVPWLASNLQRYDVVIVHGLWLYHGFALEKALRQLSQSQTKVPRLFVMPHGMLDPYFQRDPSRRLKAIRNWVYWKIIENRLIHAADGLLFTCEEEKLLARESFRPYHPKLEKVVGLGVQEPPVFESSMRDAFSEACPSLGDRPYLLFLSRIHPKKGVDLLIRAYAELARERLSDQCSDFSVQKPPFPDLVIAGPLDSDYAREMQALANQLLPPQPYICPPPTANSPPPTAHCPPPTDNSQGLRQGPLKTEYCQLKTPSIHFPGMLQGDAKWGAFYGCEAFVLPSHQENFGIAVVEALACGKPVLISNKVNIWREIIGIGGGIDGADTFEGTVGLLNKYLHLNQGGLESMKRNALACFDRNFNITSAAERMIAALSPKL